ncbi:peptidoglycan recognition protein family protein [Sulfuriroseicoccus oceanibius]|uniref:N-acetylmuramoyl-L-alanine amidase n=1 Tax=Sulfuriroseicoccus oceanibius TaxID=2707525 RepID=A0A6B3LBW3_9BACT|nr:N-acetylmuramoyl-L-alanine amidase [Sulfuriroseicoccus oceanibius]QQL45166.1 N-acetylmuramoyl-L-alanine amidase [Sulfuriroseicoccus oceanibius]
MPPAIRLLLTATLGALVVLASTSCQSSKLTYLEPPTQFESPEELFYSLNLEQDFIRRGTAGRWKFRPMQPRYITLHSTQNYAHGADAHRHALALKRGALKGHNSLGYMTWHFTVDDYHTVQHLPTSERGEHADFEGPGNRYSIGIEMCEHAGHDRAKTVDRSARLAAALMHAYDIPLRNVVPHHHWPRAYYKQPHKNCPHFLLDNGKPGATWRDYRKRVKAYYTQIKDKKLAAPVFPLSPGRVTRIDRDNHGPRG